MPKIPRRVPESVLRLYDVVSRIGYLIPFRGFPLHGANLYKPFFIIGSGRSGNTLLRRILCANPDIHIPPETYVLGPVIRTFRRYCMLPWRELTYLVLSNFEFHPEFETFGISLRGLAGELLQTSRADRSLAHLLNSFYAFTARSQGKPGARWGDKTPMNTFYLDRIHDVFPDAQYLHMLRDGCDVAASYCQAGIYPDVYSAADRWLTSIRAANVFSKKHPGSVLEIRYEQLVNDPRHTVEEICGFLEIRFEETMLDSQAVASQMGDVPARSHHEQLKNPISSSSIGKGRRSLTAEQRLLLQKRIGPALASFGYPPCTAD